MLISAVPSAMLVGYIGQQQVLISAVPSAMLVGLYRTTASADQCCAFSYASRAI